MEDPRACYACLAALVVALTLLAAAGAPPAPHMTGPPPGHTGGFGEPTCAVCHEGSALNAFGGSVVLEGLPTRYSPGAQYVLTVVLTADETEVAGFQLAVRFSGGAGWGRSAGVFSPIDLRVAVTSGESGQPYAHHTEVGSIVATDTGSSWSVEWIAPEKGGPVAFHVAANSGNGDNSPLSDLVFVSQMILAPTR